MDDESLRVALVLTQLVALTLPAIAIFMDFIGDIPSRSISLEKPKLIRIFHLSIVLLVLAIGIVDVFLVFRTSISIFIKAAALTIGVALVVLAYATWQVKNPSSASHHDF